MKSSERPSWQYGRFHVLLAAWGLRSSSSQSLLHQSSGDALGLLGHRLGGCDWAGGSSSSHWPGFARRTAGSEAPFGKAIANL